MIPTLHEVFSLVCGQVAERSWAPGGELLPFCQRCTGLYVGAAVATLSSWLLSVRPGVRRLQLDGMCLLQMVPLGFHWLPHGPSVRTASGWIFAIGLVDFLWLLPAARWRGGGAVGGAVRSWWQAAVTVLLMPAALLASNSGLAWVSWAMAWLGFAGLLGLAGLVLVNVYLLVGDGWQRLRPKSR